MITGKTQWLICNAFIEKRAKESKASLLSLLPAELKKEASSLLPVDQKLSAGFNQTAHLMEWTHYSWFAPFLRTLSEKEIPIFLSAFSEEKAKSLSELLLFSAPISSCSLLTKKFLQKEITHSLLQDNPDLMPIEALPSSSLDILLSLSAKGLKTLTEFLGLHDLAPSFRQIIDTTKIKKIQSYLSKEKLLFLSNVSQKKQSLLFQPLKLDPWIDKKEELLGLLAKRGMNRLSKALCEENPHFVWYIKRRMSREDAELFSSFHAKLNQPKAYKILAEQIQEAITFLQAIQGLL
jgi:hypothetical protein